MVTPSRRRRTIVGLVAAVALLALAVTAIAILRQAAAPPPSPPPGSLRIYRPSQPRPPWLFRVLGERLIGRPAPAPLGVPCGPPLPGTPYVPIPPGGPAPHPAGVAFARYPSPPGAAEAHYRTPPPAPAGVATVAVLADLRYDVAGRTINVITCAPSPEIARQELILGNTEVALGGGRIGFLENVGGNPPLVVIRFVDGPLVIDVSSADPAADVAGVARAVVVSK